VGSTSVVVVVVVVVFFLFFVFLFFFCLEVNAYEELAVRLFHLRNYRTYSDKI
jgi:hypothetical protein